MWTNREIWQNLSQLNDIFSVASTRIQILRTQIVGLVLVLIGLAIYACHPQTQEFSEYRDLVENSTVRILRDTWGVPHIFGKKDADASIGLASAHAEDDFLTIQQTLIRRI